MSRPRVSARPLTEGAMFAALAVVLALVGFYVPVMGIFTTFLWPVPIALIAVRHGMRTAVMTVVTAAVVLSTFIGVMEGALTSITLGLTGLAIGFGLRRKWGASSTLLLASAAVAVGFGLTIAAGMLVMKINILTEMMDQLAFASEKSIEMYKSMADQFGIPMEALQPVMQAFGPEAMKLMRIMIPGTLFITFPLTAYFNFEVCRKILPRFGYPVPEFPAFENWKFPRYTALIFIAAQLLAVLKDATVIQFMGQSIQIAPHGELLFNIGLNITTPTSIMMFIQGFAIGYYFLVYKVKLTRPWAKVLLAFIFFNPGLNQIAFTFGLLDNVFDYRRFISAVPQAQK